MKFNEDESEKIQNFFYENNRSALGKVNYHSKLMRYYR